MFPEKIPFLYPPNILLKHIPYCVYTLTFLYVGLLNEVHLKDFFKSLDRISAGPMVKVSVLFSV